MESEREGERGRVHPSVKESADFFGCLSQLHIPPVLILPLHMIVDRLSLIKSAAESVPNIPCYESLSSASSGWLKQKH